MRSTRLYWVDGPGPGKLALAARPRGGDWLEDEIAGWRREGVDSIVPLLTSEEERDLDLAGEEATAKSHGVRFFRFPIVDRQTPESERELAHSLEELDVELTAGRNVVVHCRQGIGRTGLFAACLLVGRGGAPEAAVERLSAARGVPVPETQAQRRWIDRYARVPALPHHE